MNWYKKAKNEFNFAEEMRDIWKAMVRKEQDRAGISFDLENDDEAGNLRKIELETNIKSREDIGSDKISLFAQLCYTGGDWENPVAYFKCQIKEKHSTGPKFIYVPNKKEGNINLVPSKQDNKFVASDNNDQEAGDFKEKQLWDSLKKHVEKRANDFYNKQDYDFDGAKELGMYGWSNSLGVISN